MPDTTQQMMTNAAYEIKKIKSLYDGPDNKEQAIAVAQTWALLAIANELVALNAALKAVTYKSSINICTNSTDL